MLLDFVLSPFSHVCWFIGLFQMQRRLTIPIRDSIIIITLDICYPIYKYIFHFKNFIRFINDCINTLELSLCKKFSILNFNYISSNNLIHLQSSWISFLSSESPLRRTFSTGITEGIVLFINDSRNLKFSIANRSFRRSKVVPRMQARK